MDSPGSDGDPSVRNEEKDAEIRRLTELLEESRQEAYELRSRLQIAEKCVVDYEAELEALQQDAFEKDKLHAATIREIQDERSNAVKEAEEKVEHWELQCQLISEKLEGMQNKLEANSLNTEILTKEKNETTALYNELQETMEALTLSTAACNQHKEFISVLQKEKRDLAQRVETLEENLQLYKEHLSISKEQLSAQTEEFKELQEQLAVTQTELAALRATPDVQSRGNSLFAEVEDNRQQMAKRYRLMLAKFEHMKKDFSAKCSEIAKLKKEKTILCEKLDVAERVAKKHYKGFVENYELRIKELQMTINDLKNDVKPVYLNGNDEILKFAEQTVLNSRKDILSLREEMETRSALRLNEAAELLKTRGELAQARADLRKSSLQIRELMNILNEQGMADPTLTISELPSPEENSALELKITNSNRILELNSLVPIKPKKALVTDEVIRKFDPMKRNFKDETIVPEDLGELSNKNVPETTAGTLVTSEGPENKITMATDEKLPDGSRLSNDNLADGSNAANLAAELGFEKALETDFDSGSGFEACSTSITNSESEGTFNELETSVEEERLVGRKLLEELGILKALDELSEPFEDDGVSAAVVHSSSSPVCRDMEEKTNFQSEINDWPPRSVAKSCVEERTPCSLSVQSSESYVNIDATLDKDGVEWRLNPTMEEEVSRSILKVRPNFSAFGNSTGNVKKLVHFGIEEIEVGEVGEGNSGSRIGNTDDVESNKENSAGIIEKNGGEEKKPRRRPRPKQTHPIIYMT